MFDVEEYGRRFSDIYDTLIPPSTFTPAMVEWVLSRTQTRTPEVIELGVGTGRVLVPLANELSRRGAKESLVGVDSSPEMLRELKQRRPDANIQSACADIRTFRSERKFDLVVCVCNTIGMSVDEGGEEAVMRTAASLLRTGGTLLVESQNSDTVRAVFGSGGPGSFFAPYPGKNRGLVSFGHITDSVLTLDEVWLDGADVSTRSESVHLSECAELIDWAKEYKLNLVEHCSDLEGGDLTKPTVHDVLVFRAA